MDYGAVLTFLQGAFSELKAVYLFGSQAAGTARPDSDVDLAVFANDRKDAVAYWELANEVALIVGRDVDLVDLTTASTVMQHQIITTGKRIWVSDKPGDKLATDLYALFIADEKARFDELHHKSINDVLIEKITKIERCVGRIKEEYEKDITTFATDYTRQDAAILNIQRACEASIDVGQYLIRRDKLGVPQSAREVFSILAERHYIAPILAVHLQKMVSFRNIAVHDYKSLQLPIIESIIKQHLTDFLNYGQQLLAFENARSS